MGIKARLNWIEELQFAARAGKGPVVITDSSDGGGGPSPMELVLIGVAGCTAIDVVLILKKKRLDLKNFEVLIEGEQEEDHPKRFKQIKIEYVVSGKNITPKAVEQAIELSEKKYCSAMASIDAEFTHVYRIKDD
mgnify:CR=1 FL=1